jgi:hypothetical protein
MTNRPDWRPIQMGRRGVTERLLTSRQVGLDRRHGLDRDKRSQGAHGSPYIQTVEGRFSNNLCPGCVCARSLMLIVPGDLG